MRRHFLLVYCCLGVQMIALVVVVYKENLAAADHRLEGKPLLRLKRAMYAIGLVTWSIIAIAQWK